MEAVFSHWRAESPVSTLNRSRSLDWFSVPRELVEAVKLAKVIADNTNGALDITIAPLIDLWGFGAKGRIAEVPSEEAIREAKKICGWQYLEWREEPPALRKKIPEIQINVASVTEGVVIEHLVRLLKGRGLEHFLLEVGGEVAAVGNGPDGQPWLVGIQTPDAKQGDALQALPMRDLCVSTSGNYRHRISVSGKTFSHLIDPRTGKPVTHGLRSVSVIHPRCDLADGYATALMILGPVEGVRVAEGLGLRVVWVAEE